VKVHEYVAKELFARHHIPVPRGVRVERVEQVAPAVQSLGLPVVLKAQVLVAGRGKAGGIQVAETAEEAEAKARALLRAEIKGLRVNQLLIEERIAKTRELYVACTIDRAQRMPVLIASRQGGEEIEELARTRPETVHRQPIDPLVGLRSYQARSAAKAAAVSGGQADAFLEVCQRLYALFTTLDCELVESNPLIVTPEGRLVAADARILVDDNALARHSDVARANDDLAPLEAEAQQKGFSFVELDGNVGIIGNGAGLVMATLDMVAHFGGRPADFLDVGGGASAAVVRDAIALLLRQGQSKVILVNILGGITRCDEVAAGLIAALNATVTRPAMVVRLVGTNEEEGQELLRAAHIESVRSMEKAASAAVELARR
jgi:succinyl-CoA synthetase beta subunit